MDMPKSDRGKSPRSKYNEAIWTPDYALRLGSQNTEKTAGVLLGLKETEKLPPLAVDKKSRFNHTH